MTAWLLLFFVYSAQARTVWVVENEIEPSAKPSVQVAARFRRVHLDRQLRSIYQKIVWANPSSVVAVQDSTENIDLISFSDRIENISSAAWAHVRWAAFFGERAIEISDPVRGSGLATVLAHPWRGGFSEFFLDRWLSQWGSGQGLQQSTQAAFRDAVEILDRINPYLESRVQGQPVRILLTGVDRTLHATSTASALWSQSYRAASRPFSSGGVHSDLQELTLQLASALALPTVPVDANRLQSSTEWVSLFAQIAWDHRLGGQDFIDGDALRYALSDPALGFGDGLKDILKHLIGARLVKKDDRLEVQILLDQSLKIPLGDPNEGKKIVGFAANLSLPQDIRLDIKLEGEHLLVDQMDQKGKCARVQVRLGLLWRWINLRAVSVHLSTGEAEIQAGLLNDHLSLVGKARIFAAKFTGLDIWQTMRANLPLLHGKGFVFR